MSFSRQQRIALIGFAVFVIGAFVIAAAALGIGNPSLSDGEVAVIQDAPGGAITQEDFDRSLAQTAARQGLKQPPAAGDPQYQQFADSALSDLLLARWVLGEGDERGIEVSDRQIDDELEKVKSQQFGSEKAFQKFLDQSGFTLDEARDRIRLQLISSAIQEDVLPAEPSVSDAEIQTYYDENKAQFEQPETRDVRVVLTKSEDDATAAKQALGSAPTPKTWEDVAKKYSIDEATKATGGLREAVVAGQSEPQLDSQIFSATEGELVGPFKTDSGYYVISVEKVTPGQTTPLADVSDQIKQTLVSARQQEIATNFQNDFEQKWVSRTYCADDVATDRCSNAPPAPDTCVGDDDGEQLPADPTTGKTSGVLQCDAFVPSTKPIQPGTAAPFGAPATQGLPQGPITPVAAAGLPQGIPPGVTIPGATAPPPGTAPQTAPPPGG